MRNAFKPATVRDQKARGEVVAAVEDNVIAADRLPDVRYPKSFGYDFDLAAGIDSLYASSCRGGLVITQVVHPMYDLPLEIRHFHCVVVGNSQFANASCRQIQECGGTQAAGTDHKNTGRQ